MNELWRLFQKYCDQMDQKYKYTPYRYMKLEIGVDGSGKIISGEGSMIYFNSIMDGIEVLRSLTGES